jgi:hypothetical protein
MHVVAIPDPRLELAPFHEHAHEVREGMGWIMRVNY